MQTFLDGRFIEIKGVEPVGRMSKEVKLLHVDEVGPEENFFDLGGTSLLVTNVVIAAGNAPTALLRTAELIEEGFRPALVIGVPVGFVNVVQSKEILMETGIPCIVNRGRKGGSNVAAAIVNALLYSLDSTRGA